MGELDDIKPEGGELKLVVWIAVAGSANLAAAVTAAVVYLIKGLAE